MPSFLGLWGKGRAVLEFLRSSLSCQQLCFRFIRRRGKQRKTEREREILRETEIYRGERNCPDASNWVDTQGTLCLLTSQLFCRWFPSPLLNPTWFVRVCHNSKSPYKCSITGRGLQGQKLGLNYLLSTCVSSKTLFPWKHPREPEWWIKVCLIFFFN